MANIKIIFGVVILIGLIVAGFYFVSSTDTFQEDTKLTLNSNSTKINENTTTVKVIGHTEPGATVTINSNDSSIATLYPKVSSNGDFYYEITVPTSMEHMVLIVEAIANDKKPSTAIFTIERIPPITVVDTPNGTNNNTTNSTPVENFIGNKYSMIFHVPSCEWVEKMSENNKIIFENRIDAINQGYQPCKACKP